MQLSLRHLEINKKLCQNPMPHINPGGASRLTADTPNRGESDQGSSAGNEKLLAGCVAAVNKLLCDTPLVDLSRDRTALSGSSVADSTEQLDPQEHREFRSGAGICQYMTEQRFDIAFTDHSLKNKTEENRALPQKDVSDVY